jgi:hypothetical protein
MNRIGRWVAVAGMITGLVAVIPPSAALASTGTAAESASPTDVAAPSQSQLAPDGYLYAWDYPNRRGDRCRWFYDDRDWDTCAWAGVRTSMFDKATSLHNNGYASNLAHVNLYFGRGHLGAYRCMPNGTIWLDLVNRPVTFNQNPGEGGYGQSLNNNVASHKWVQRCP